MKIRFSMEIKGCRWHTKNDLLNCPFLWTTHSMKSCEHRSHPNGYRQLPKRLNPSWCPMMKGGKG
jgi:hypothetical protein